MIKRRLTSCKNHIQSILLLNIINEYTKLDPTLPRIKNMKCPNDKCPTNESEEIKGEKEIPESEIIYLRYDDINMKFIYLCAECNQTV